MAVKKYRIGHLSIVYRVYWDGRAIIIDKLDEQNKWKIVGSGYKKKGYGFQTKTFLHDDLYDHTSGIYNYSTEYASAASTIKSLEYRYSFDIPEEVKEYLIAFDTMTHLTS